MIPVSRLPDTAGVDDPGAFQFQAHRHMSMADTYEVDVNVLQPTFPGFCGTVHIFVQRVTRRSVHQQKRMVADRQMLCDGKLSQPG